MEFVRFYLPVVQHLHDLLLSEDGGTAGGVYLWKSKEDATGLYTEEWESMIRERYGALPTVTYFESPVIIDNQVNEIIADA